MRGLQLIEIVVLDDVERAEALLLGMTDLVGEVQVTSDFRPMEAVEETSSASGQTLQRALHRGQGSVLQIGYIGNVDEEYQVLAALVQAGIKVRAFYTPETDLEDVFLRVTKGQVA